jgi:hypothetical protein
VQSSNIGSGIPGGDRGDCSLKAKGLHPEKSPSWGLISAALIDRPGREAISLSSHHRVVVSLTAVQGLVHIDGGPAKSAVFSPDEISFTPDGVSTRTILPAGRLMQALQSPETYQTIIAEMLRSGTVDFETRFPIDDPLVSQIVSTLAHEVESGFLDHILVDALNTALAVRIMRHLVDPSKIAPPPSNGLSRERLQRGCDSSQRSAIKTREVRVSTVSKTDAMKHYPPPAEAEEGIPESNRGLKRRDLLRSGSSLLAMSALITTGLPKPVAAQQAQPAAAQLSGRPNILVIFGDEIY